MTKREIQSEQLRHVGLRFGRTNLEEGQQLVLKPGLIYRYFGKELLERMSRRAGVPTGGGEEEESSWTDGGPDDCEK